MKRSKKILISTALLNFGFNYARKKASKLKFGAIVLGFYQVAHANYNKVGKIIKSKKEQIFTRAIIHSVIPILAIDKKKWLTYTQTQASKMQVSKTQVLEMHK